MLKIGTILHVHKPPFLHKGIYVGNGYVFHNRPGRGEHLSTIEEFRQGQGITVKLTEADAAAVLTRVLEALKYPRGYSAISYNCEHSISRILYGKSESPQLWAVSSLLIVGCLALFIFPKK